jgi:hypothetical protein
MAKPTNTPIAGEIWHLSIEDLLAPVHEKQRLGGDGPFVINLSVSAAPMSLPEKKFAGCRNAHEYQIHVTEDGRMRYRLRLGPFASEDEADAVLKEVRDMYPGAFTATALAADLRLIASIQAKLDSMKPLPQKPENAAVEVTLDLSQPLARAAAIAAATLAGAPKAKNLVATPATPATFATSAASRPSANAIPVAAPPPELSPAWAMPVLNSRVTRGHQTRATPSPGPAPSRAAAAIRAPTPISLAPAPAAIANPAPILTEMVAIATAPRVRAAAPLQKAPIPKAPIPKAPPASAPRNPAPLVTGAAEIAPKVPATPISAPVIVKAVAPIPREPPVAAAPSNPTPVVTRAPNPAPNPPARTERPPALRPVMSRPMAPQWVSSRWAAPKPSAPRQAAPSPAAASKPAAPGPATQIPAARVPAAENLNPPRPGFARSELVAVATVPAAHPVKQLSQPLDNLEHTQTMRALTAPELEDAEARRWFVIQLAVADRAFDPDAVPNLDIFSEYRLYSVAWEDQGHNVHALRLGFFSEEIAAVAVASYLGAHYDKPTIRRVSVAERERFAASQRVEARKDVGETGKHAAIEITNELVDRRRRTASAAAKRAKSNKNVARHSPPPR